VLTHWIFQACTADSAREIQYMDKELLKDSFGWGFVLWLIGYILGIVLFFALPVPLIGWVILPVGVVVTLWVLMARVRSNRFAHFVVIAAVWTVLAVVLDYFLIVKAFHPPDGYYKVDVYLYYALTLAMPLAVGWWRRQP
jgi:hypothetical protein